MSNPSLPPWGRRQRSRRSCPRRMRLAHWPPTSSVRVWANGPHWLDSRRRLCVRTRSRRYHERCCSPVSSPRHGALKPGRVGLSSRTAWRCPDTTARGRLGAQLAQAGVAESRVTKLLTARGEAFRQLVPRMLRLLASKRIAPNWFELGELVLKEGSGERDDLERAEQLRLRIASAYFSAEAAKG